MKYLTHLDFQRQNPINLKEQKKTKKREQPTNSSTFDNNSFIAQFSNIPNGLENNHLKCNGERTHFRLLNFIFIGLRTLIGMRLHSPTYVNQNIYAYV